MRSEECLSSPYIFYPCTPAARPSAAPLFLSGTGCCGGSVSAESRWVVVCGTLAPVCGRFYPGQVAAAANVSAESNCVVVGGTLAPVCGRGHGGFMQAKWSRRKGERRGALYRRRANKRQPSQKGGCFGVKEDDDAYLILRPAVGAYRLLTMTKLVSRTPWRSTCWALRT